MLKRICAIKRNRKIEFPSIALKGRIHDFPNVMNYLLRSVSTENLLENLEIHSLGIFSAFED